MLNQIDPRLEKFWRKFEVEPSDEVFIDNTVKHVKGARAA
jgi:FMN phosphatase YigB (HAD superfamily)